MALFSHKNVVSIIGVVTAPRDFPVRIFPELAMGSCSAII